MSEEKILRIANNPIAVIDIIQEIDRNFPTIFEGLNHYTRDSYSFYHTGHCPSFARIMYEIFDGHVTIKDKSDHVIVKIGENHFDISGCVDGIENLDEYRECPIAYFPMVEETIGRTDDHDQELIEIFVKIGKRRMLELAQTLEPEETQEEHRKAM